LGMFYNCLFSKIWKNWYFVSEVISFNNL
jgi:hypothetical protein